MEVKIYDKARELVAEAKTDDGFIFYEISNIELVLVGCYYQIEFNNSRMSKQCTNVDRNILVATFK